MKPIDRREFLLRSGTAAAVAASACGGGSGGPARARRPNVVLIMADDLGYECLGCYGGTSYKTPRLDELARTGIRFDHAYSQPLCTPTRLQLMTGQYNFRNWQAFGVLPPDETTFGHMMRAAGYKTCIAGKWQLYSYNPPDFEPEWRGKGMRAEDAGFDEYFLWHAEHTEDKGSRYADPKILDNGEYLQDTAGKYGPDPLRPTHQRLHRAVQGRAFFRLLSDGADARTVQPDAPQRGMGARRPLRIERRKAFRRHGRVHGRSRRRIIDRWTSWACARIR